jgi:hypothetical protein
VITNFLEGFSASDGGQGGLGDSLSVLSPYMKGGDRDAHVIIH